MKSYVITTGSLFALLTVAHVWRLIEEGRQLATNPWWMLITLAGAHSRRGRGVCCGSRRGRNQRALLGAVPSLRLPHCSSSLA
jgi:hypothetical protein